MILSQAKMCQRKCVNSQKMRNNNNSANTTLVRLEESISESDKRWAAGDGGLYIEGSRSLTASSHQMASDWHHNFCHFVCDQNTFRAFCLHYSLDKHIFWSNDTVPTTGRLWWVGLEMNETSNLCSRPVLQLSFSMSSLLMLHLVPEVFHLVDSHFNFNHDETYR